MPREASAPYATFLPPPQTTPAPPSPPRARLQASLLCAAHPPAGVDGTGGAPGELTAGFFPAAGQAAPGVTRRSTTLFLLCLYHQSTKPYERLERGANRRPERIVSADPVG